MAANPKPPRLSLSARATSAVRDLDVLCRTHI